MLGRLLGICEFEGAWVGLSWRGEGEGVGWEERRETGNGRADWRLRRVWVSIGNVTSLKNPLEIQPRRMRR